MASRSLAAAASRSTAGWGCGAVCGVLRDPVLRALTGASRTASLGTAPGLKAKMRELSRIEKFTNYVTKNEIQMLTQIEHSCSAFSWRSFEPGASSCPSKTAPRAPPSCRPDGSRRPTRTTPLPPRPRSRGSAPGAQATPRRPPAWMTPAPHPRGRDSPRTPLRPPAPLAPRLLPLPRPTGRTVGGSRAHLPHRSSERGPRHPRPPPRPPPRTQVWRAAASPPRERACTPCRASPSSSFSSRLSPPPRPSASSSSPRGGD